MKQWKVSFCKDYAIVEAETKEAAKKYAQEHYYFCSPERVAFFNQPDQDGYQKKYRVTVREYKRDLFAPLYD